ncbi:MAG: adenylate/guanylate cyclase domain-containing protein [Chloroflexota bacterium]
MVRCASCGTQNPAEARFCLSCGTQIGAAAPASRETRKTVTVLFIDAASSTALGERMDPESLRAVMTRYFDAMREAIERHGGSVEKFIGDAVMAVFGVPTLHEDDALRACRAAVEIRQRLNELEPQIRADRGVAIEWRMGINTGPVVAGDVAAGQRMVTGDAVNVAARLEAAAAPGEILMGEETHALVHDAVTAEPIPALSLKGKSEPVPAWRLAAVDETHGRHVRPQEAPLIGRRRPMQLLDGAFREAVEEQVCHLFTVLGTAGVGKSRLVEEFIATLGEQARVAHGRCLAYGSGITYWPVAEALRSGIGIGESASADEASAALSLVLAGESEAERIAAAAGSLLGVNADSHHDQEELFWAVRKTFEALARAKPLVLVLDDIHWGESTFLDLVEHIADWTRDAPILLIAMARSELLEKRPAWGGGKRSATTVQLEPLSAGESEELLGSLLGKAELSPDFRAQVSAAAEGNPLFVEELLAKLIDDGFLERGDGGWVAAGDLRDLAIPSSIQALLAARLDGLGEEERTVIESAAVEGKTFHRGAVTALAAEPLRDHVRDRLAGLVRMELVRPDQATFVGEEAYRFRHLLIRDAAYQAIAKQTRSELHERFAAWLDVVAADRLVEFEEIIAYHLEQAYRYRAELGPADARAQKLALRAGTLLADAGERADRRADAAATVDLLGRAVELLAGDLPRRRRLLSRLGDRCFEAGDAPRAEQILADAIAEADRAGDKGASALCSLGLLMVRASTRATEMSESMREAERHGAILARVGDTAGARLAEGMIAFLLFAMGRAGEATQRAAALLELGDGDERWQREAQMARGVSLVWGPTPVEEAIVGLQAQIDRAHGDKRVTGAYRGISRLLVLQGRFAEARELIARARAAAQDLGDRIQIADCFGEEGGIEHQAGNLSEAARLTREAYEAMIAIGDRSFASTYAAVYGEVLLDLEEGDEAWRFGTIARETSSTDDVMSQAVGRAVQARVLSRRGDHGAAEALAGEALAIMARTDYLSIHGAVLIHLAYVLHGGGRTAEAIEAARQALNLYGQKGATFFVERTENLIQEWGAAPD